jgi:hypothetical protein
LSTINPTYQTRERTRALLVKHRDNFTFYQQYGRECWSMGKAEEQGTGKAQMRYLRPETGITRTQMRKFDSNLMMIIWAMKL